MFFFNFLISEALFFHNEIYQHFPRTNVCESANFRFLVEEESRNIFSPIVKLTFILYHLFIKVEENVLKRVKR